MATTCRRSQNRDTPIPGMTLTALTTVAGMTGGLKTRAAGTAVTAETARHDLRRRAKGGSAGQAAAVKDPAPVLA